MPRKLKTYQTSIGFFDLAVAAPSMKAALEAWGSGSNLFQLGAAKETDDPTIVAATMARPGVVLKRPVGSKGAFSENAKLPKHLPVDDSDQKLTDLQPKSKKLPVQKTGNEKAAREAALAFERVQKQREAQRQKEEAAKDRENRRRQKAIAEAETALEEARREHDAKAQLIDNERAFLDRRSQAEDARWKKKLDELEAALHRAHE